MTRARRRLLVVAIALVTLAVFAPCTGNDFVGLALLSRLRGDPAPRAGARAADVETRVHLGVALASAGKLDEAIHALQQAVARNPGHARARDELARAYVARGEPDRPRSK